MGLGLKFLMSFWASVSLEVTWAQVTLWRLCLCVLDKSRAASRAVCWQVLLGAGLGHTDASVPRFPCSWDSEVTLMVLWCLPAVGRPFCAP